MRVDGDRLARSLDELAAFGRDPQGGWSRPALSEADAAARALARTWLRELDLEVFHDEVGNLFGRRAGRDPAAPCVMTGSHLDSVPRGGRFDGPLGVVGAIEAVRALGGRATTRAIEIVVFTGEEGSRFPRGTIGSAAVAGDVPVADILALRDAAGVSFAAALPTYGDAGPARPARRAPGSVHAYVELHIEQGGVLEARGVAAGPCIGSVTAIAGLVQHVIRFEGDANHAGATPMDLRRDALACAAELALAVERIPLELGAGAVGTVGKLDVEPGGFNVIPGAATMTTDLRASRPDLLDALDARVLEAAREIAARRRARLASFTRRQRVEPGPMHELVVGAVDGAAAAAGLASHRMISGAIHDALHMANLCPSGMIFVPSRGGKSHCPEEDTALSEMTHGVEVLARTLDRLAD